ncbi:MAG: peptide ABC transporter substrate-binding protein [Vulcanimicrobiaceae bacterium]
MRAIAFALLVALTTVGCSRVATAPPPGGGAHAAHAWTRHGLLRIANLSEPDSLNPIVGSQQIDADLAYLWGGYLFNLSDRDAFVPELATVVPTLANGGISRDGKTIVYHLRPGVRWHDGAPFGADDVIFTWHAVLNKKNNVPSTAGYDTVARIDKRDDRTIVVHLKNAYAPFVATFFAPSSVPYPILPAHLLAAYPNINRAAYNSQPIGTGPFVAQRWQRGSKIVFRANPHYWRGAPKLKEIWYAPVPDDNTIVTQLRAHETDLDYNGSTTQYQQFRQLDGFETTLTPFTSYSQFALNTSAPIMRDRNVRRALWYALDTSGIIRNVSHGVSIPAVSDQPAFSWAYTGDVARYPYDPARARAVLDAAGWRPGSDGVRVKAGKRLTIVLAGSSGSAAGNAVDVLAQRNWHDVGIDAQIKLYPTSLFFASAGAGGIVQNSKFDVALFSWVNGADPDDSTQFMCDQFPPAGQNVYRYCDRDVDAAERIALSTNDRGIRARAYHGVQSALARDVPVIFVSFARRITVKNTDLKNYRPAHAVTNFWNSYEWEI